MQNTFTLSQDPQKSQCILGLTLSPKISSKHHCWGACVAPLVTVRLLIFRQTHRGEDTQRGEGTMTPGADPRDEGTRQGKLRNVYSFQKLEGAKNNSLRSDTALLASWFETSAQSRYVREYISIVLSYQVCYNLLQQPQEMNTGAFEVFIAVFLLKIELLLLYVI